LHSDAAYGKLGGVQVFDLHLTERSGSCGTLAIRQLLRLRLVAETEDDGGNAYLINEKFHAVPPALWGLLVRLGKIYAGMFWGWMERG
ncbi:MAG: hypothetical protein D3908_02810, partial [Candidatus Electrothrix sp. AUS4]|nr:hypothetical protein [Candidatus Electrothrix sp. AUS4]